MLRTKFPFGYCTPNLYLALDRLSGAYGNGTLRATTRQTLQLHAVHKRDFRTVQQTIINELGSCLAACGDVNRNVMAPCMPFKNKPEYIAAQEAAKDIADLLSP